MSTKVPEDREVPVGAGVSAPEPETGPKMTIKVPKDRAVPFGAVTPAPVMAQELFITSNWRIVRPVLDREKCALCFQCVMSCPDSCWSFNEEKEEVEWNWRYCKGCQICIHECSAEALTAEPELDFPDGVVRLEKPF